MTNIDTNRTVIEDSPIWRSEDQVDNYLELPQLFLKQLDLILHNIFFVNNPNTKSMVIPLHPIKDTKAQVSIKKDNQEYISNPLNPQKVQKKQHQTQKYKPRQLMTSERVRLKSCFIDKLEFYRNLKSCQNWCHDLCFQILILMKQDVAVALVSDFFYPSLGGVEVHIKQMSKVLKQRVRKVIVVTHCYPPDYYGVKDIDGVKAYYLPFLIIGSSNTILPNFVTDYPQAKNILISEGIDIVHTHQSTSPLGMAFGIQGYHLGLRVVHTEHSLFEFKKLDGIIIPWVLTPIHQLYDKFICVSRATRNNLIIRNKQHSQKSIVIPNSVQTRCVEGGQRKNKDEAIRLVLCSRMVFRRGIDILIELLPELCERNKDFIIELIGDGPKMKPLREMIKINRLESRTVVHGGLPNQKALAIVKQCHIFLNTALTQSFGIAIVEAASLGLHVITSNVGGVGEVLPPEHMHIAQLTKQGFMKKIEQVATLIHKQRAQFTKNGGIVKPQLNLYPKEQVFQRVSEVYEQVMQIPRKSKIPNLFYSLMIKGNLISCIILSLLFLYTLWDILQAIVNKIKSISNGSRFR